MNPKDIKDAVEGAVDALDTKPEKKTFSQSVLVSVISALIGTVTTWGLSIDHRIYNLTQSSATVHEVSKMEERIVDRIRDVTIAINQLRHKVDQHLEKHK